MKELRCPNCALEFDSCARFCTQCACRLQPIDISCNMCGLSCRLGHDETPSSGLHGLIYQKIRGYYESTAGNGYGALDDDTTYTFSLCEFCLDWLFSKFQLKVSVSDYSGRQTEQQHFRPAAQRVAEDEWRKMKKEFTEEHDKRAAARNK